MKLSKIGQGLVEYAVLVAIIVAVVIIAARPLRNAINTAFIRAATQINSAS